MEGKESRARWIPGPAWGLPALIAASLSISGLTVAFQLPFGLLSLVAVPILFVASRWSRAPSYAAIVGILVGAAVINGLDARGGLDSMQRTLIQCIALALMWEAVHAAARSRDRANAELAASEARYRLIVESSNVIPFEFDLASFRFTYVGPQAEPILGHPPSDWLGAGFWEENIHPEDRDEAVSFCAAATARGEDHAFDYRMLDASGAVVWIHEVVTIAGDRRAPVGIRGVMVDITERKQAEEERRRLEARVLESQKLESLGLVAGGVAHDFNNLLTAVLGNAALVLDDLPPDHPSRARIEDLATAAQRGAELTSQMLAYTGQARLETRSQDLSEMVRETARLLASSITKKADLQLDLEHPVWVRADPGQLHQVVMNLVTNASDSLGGEQGVISVRTGIDASGPHGVVGPRAFLEVADDGVGMDEDTLRDMFDPFFTTKFSGRGLGLAAVHGIVRSHGGNIRVDSEPGHGTRVRVLLPLGEALPADATRQAPRQGGQAAEGARVLVVDDEPQVRAVARGLLERCGYQVILAADGDEALCELAEHPIDAVLLDLTMPKLSGAETLKAIRDERPDLPVLLMSGYARERCEGLDEDGPTDFLHKPFRPEELSKRLATLLEARVGFEEV